MRLEKKKKKEKEKLVKKQSVLIEKSSIEAIKNDNYLSTFDKIKERIFTKNISKPNPDINDIPE